MPAHTANAELDCESRGKKGSASACPALPKKQPTQIHDEVHSLYRDVSLANTGPGGVGDGCQGRLCDFKDGLGELGGRVRWRFVCGVVWCTLATQANPTPSAPAASSAYLVVNVPAQKAAGRPVEPKLVIRGEVGSVNVRHCREAVLVGIAWAGVHARPRIPLGGKGRVGTL